MQASFPLTLADWDLENAKCNLVSEGRNEKKKKKEKQRPTRFIHKIGICFRLQQMDFSQISKQSLNWIERNKEFGARVQMNRECFLYVNWIVQNHSHDQKNMTICWEQFLVYGVHIGRLHGRHY